MRVFSIEFSKEHNGEKLSVEIELDDLSDDVDVATDLAEALVREHFALPLTRRHQQLLDIYRQHRFDFKGTIGEPG